MSETNTTEAILIPALPNIGYTCRYCLKWNYFAYAACTKCGTLSDPIDHTPHKYFLSERKD